MIRDNRNKALINTDLSALNKYKKEREKSRMLNSLSEEYKEISQKIAGIYALLEKILDKMEQNSK